MCLMHDQEPYGVLCWPLKDIAQAVGCKTSDLLALVKKGVLKGDDKSLAEAFVYIPRSGRRDGTPVTLVEAQPGPIWYSSRMVKDEYVRTIRGESSRFGADNDESSKGAPKAAPKPPFGDGASSSSSSSSNSVPKGTGAKRQKTPAEQELADLWSAIKALLVEQETSATTKEAGVLVGAVAAKYGRDVFVDACRATVNAKPANAHTYLVGLCEKAAGQRPGLNRQVAQEQRNAQVADNWVPPELRQQGETADAN